MRKIKSVKLAKEFNNGDYTAPIGTKLIKESVLYHIPICYNKKWFIQENSIRINSAGLFAIEYEPEGFEFKKFNEDFPEIYFCSQLNRLADWCDGQSEKDNYSLYHMVCCNGYKHNNLETSSFSYLYYHGLQFNSKKSAELFISELNKPENSEYKNYFIELLKKTRL